MGNASAPTGFSWIALGLSAVTAALLFAFCAAIAPGDMGVTSAFHRPDPWGSAVRLTALLSPWLVILSIFFNVWAGHPGGWSRRIGVIGGVMLLSPAIYLGAAFLIPALSP